MNYVDSFADKFNLSKFNKHPVVSFVSEKTK